MMARKTLVLGLGNPLLGDDGVGWCIAEAVRHQGEDSTIEVDCLSVGGLTLMERLVGYGRVVLLDAITTGREPPGTVYSFLLDELPDSTAGHLHSPHDTTLQTALRLGRALGASLPDQVMVVAVESSHIYDFSEELTPAVAAAVPHAAQLAIRHLHDSAQEEREP